MKQTVDRKRLFHLEEDNQEMDIENDPNVLEMMEVYSKQLDKIISNSYSFADMPENSDLVDNCVQLEPSKVDHTISFHFLASIPQSEEHDKKREKHKQWKPKPKFFEEVTYEDMCTVVVSGDWVLNKVGLYGQKGRERRSELITGAFHSPALKHCNNNHQT